MMAGSSRYSLPLTVLRRSSTCVQGRRGGRGEEWLLNEATTRQSAKRASTGPSAPALPRLLPLHLSVPSTPPLRPPALAHRAHVVLVQPPAAGVGVEQHLVARRMGGGTGVHCSDKMLHVRPEAAHRRGAVTRATAFQRHPLEMPSQADCWSWHNTRSCTGPTLRLFSYSSRSLEKSCRAGGRVRGPIHVSLKLGVDVTRAAVPCSSSSRAFQPCAAAVAAAAAAQLQRGAGFDHMGQRSKPRHSRLTSVDMSPILLMGG